MANVSGEVRRRINSFCTGQGPEEYQRPDDRITEEVNDRLTRHGQIDASQIQVSVKNGEVTLTGTVNNRQAKHAGDGSLSAQVSGVAGGRVLAVSARRGWPERRGGGAAGLGGARKRAASHNRKLHALSRHERPGPRAGRIPEIGGTARRLLRDYNSHFSNKSGGTAFAHIMRQVAAGLTAAQMREVALYYASLTEATNAGGVAGGR